MVCSELLFAIAVWTRNKSYLYIPPPICNYDRAYINGHARCCAGPVWGSVCYVRYTPDGRLLHTVKKQLISAYRTVHVVVHETNRIAHHHHGYACYTSNPKTESGWVLLIDLRMRAASGLWELAQTPDWIGHGRSRLSFKLVSSSHNFRQSGHDARQIKEPLLRPRCL